MPQLHLPHEHTDADLVLAGQIASSVGSGELFIAWTVGGGPGAHPTVSATLREAAQNPAAEVLGILLECATDVLRALIRPAPPAERGRVGGQTG